MAQLLNREQKKKDAAYYIKSIIGLAIMIFFRFIPAPDPITPVGMAVLGMFIGLVFLWSTVDIVWPTVACILMFSTVALDVYAGSTVYTNGIYEAGMRSLGEMCALLGLGMIIFCDVLINSGMLRRLSTWALTRRFAMKSPWTFTFVFLFAVYVMELFIDGAPFELFMLALAKEVFAALGMKKEDKWTKVITIGLTWSIVLGYASTPICHPLTILFMSIYSGIAGATINWVAYMAIAVPATFVIFILMFLFLRFVVRPDVSKLENADFSKLEAMRPGKMEGSERLVTIILVILIIFWLLPGVLSMAAPTSGLFLWLDSITSVTPLFAALLLMAIVRFDGKPVLDIGETMSKPGNFSLYFFMAGIMLIANAFGEGTTGISAWLMNFLSPIASNMSPFGLVVFAFIASAILTNIANNVPVGIVMTSVGVPIALQLGISPFVVAVAITLGASLAYTIPPAYIPIAMCYADPYGGGKYTLRWGLVALCVTLVVGVIVVYPIGSLFM